MPAVPDGRASATLNAVLVLVLAVVPLAGTVDSATIDHREHRPWGCRTCPIPPERPVAEPVDPGL